MKTHALLFSLFLAFFSTTQHAAAQQTIELPDSALVFPGDTVTGGWGAAAAGQYWQWDAHNDITMYERRHADGGQWTNDIRELYTYDAAHRLSQYYYLLWYTGAWDTLAITQYHYDSAGSLDHTQELMRSSPYGFPAPARQVLAVYAGDINRPLIRTGQISDGAGGWNPNYRELWSYTAAGDTLVVQNWDTALHTWASSTMTIQTHGHLLSCDYAGGWVPTWSYDTIYDSRGNPVRDSSYDIVHSRTASLERISYTYDAADHILTNHIEIYQLQAWSEAGRDTFSYDADGHRVTARYTHPVFSTIDSAYTYDSLSYIDHFTKRYPQLVKNYGDSVQYYYHRAIATGVQEHTLTADISIYPMPAHDRLIVAVHTAAAETLTMEMTDMMGRTVRSGTLAEGMNHLSVNGLAPGVYTMRFAGGGTAPVSRTVIVY